MAKVSGRYKDFLHSLFPTTNIPHQSGCFVTRDEPTVTHHHPKSILYIMVHSWWYLLCIWTKVWHKFTIIVLGWPKSLFSLFHKIKGTFFIFTSNFIDLDILIISAISQVVDHWLFSVNVLIWSLSTSTGLPDRGTSSSMNSPEWNLANLFWHVQSVTVPSPYTAHKSFLHFSCVLPFLE